MPSWIRRSRSLWNCDNQRPLDELLSKKAGVLFLIEIADTTLRFPRDVSLPAYADAGIPEVWIVEVNSEAVAMYSNPIESACRSRTDLDGGDSISPLAFADLDFAGSDLLS